MSWPPWPNRIAELVMVKQRLHQVDTAGLWEFRLPRVAASEPEIEFFENRIGEALPNPYREFLTYAGGWPCLLQSTDLLGPPDAAPGSLYDQAMERVSFLQEESLEAAGVALTEIYPIAFSAVDLDLFVVTRVSSTQPGQVIWFAGYEVDRFPDFHEYFASMVGYNQYGIEALTS